MSDQLARARSREELSEAKEQPRTFDLSAARELAMLYTPAEQEGYTLVRTIILACEEIERLRQANGLLVLSHERDRMRAFIGELREWLHSPTRRKTNQQFGLVDTVTFLKWRSACEEIEQAFIDRYAERAS